MPLEGNRVLTSLVIDIPEERPTGATLVSSTWDDHISTNIGASDSVDLIINELFSRVKLGSRLGADFEDVACFDGCPSDDSRGGIAVGESTPG